MTALSKFLNKKAGETDENKMDVFGRFADQVGTSAITVFKWSINTRYPSTRFWNKIIEASNYTLDLNDLFEGSLQNRDNE